MNKQKRQTIGYILLFILGIAILAYPYVSDWWNTKIANDLMSEYDAIVEQLSEEDLSDAMKNAQWYNGTLVGNVLPDAFAEEEANSPNKEYEAILNVLGNGYMGTVEIPVIDVKLPIYHYTTEEVLLKGVGHLPGSSLPVGGESTHSVLSAHRGLPSAKLFTDLDRVKEGDVFYIHVLGETLAYQVDFIKVIEPTDTKDLSIQKGEDLCTLFTCTPYAVNSHRLLVRGSRIPYTEEQYQQELQNTAAPRAMSTILIRILCVLLGLLLAILIIWLMNRRNKKKAHAVLANKEEKEESKGEAVKSKSPKVKKPISMHERALPYISEDNPNERE